MSASTNPLLERWETPFGLPPFERFAPEHFEPALHAAMAEHRRELEAIVADPAPADFENTVAAFDRSGRLLERIASAFGALTASATNPALQAVQRRMASPLAAHWSAVYTDPRLFARLDAVHAKRASLGLDAEALRLVERLHLDFVRDGARLAPAERARYAELMQQHAELTTRFSQNLLEDEASFGLELKTEADLAGLPGFVRDAARQAAADRGREGFLIPLARSVVMPFLTFSERRDLREQVWRAWTGRGERGGATDNREIGRSILRLRNEQARLHGKSCYADHSLEDTMAGSRAAVARLLDEVWSRSLKAVARERAELDALRAAAGETDVLRDWDWRYWAEKLRQQRYALDDAELKPYFGLDNMVQAAFHCARRLFGLGFRRRTDLPVYHPDVAAYEVHDRAGRTIGVFLQDNFARPGKRSGAWMSTLRVQSRNGGEQLPLVMNNNNFAKGAPTLLSLDDVRTLFHEFGHGLHGLLSSVGYDRLSGTRVLRDFVELPSQLFEHWATEEAVLREHARHVVTGEPIPLELVQRIRRSRLAGQGYETVRYCASAIVDMALHSLADAEPPADLCAFEAQVLAGRGHPDAVGMNHRVPHFQHIFAGDSYAAGYYVYLWAEVLDADGYDAFVEAGDPFAPGIAESLRRWIYSSGDSVEPMSAYAAFRGRAPSVLPLLKKRGLLEEVTS